MLARAFRICCLALVTQPGTATSVSIVQKSPDSVEPEQSFEWGMLVHCSNSDVRAYLYKWPPGEQDKWLTLKRVKLPDSSHDLSTPHDPHPLKITSGIPKMIEQAQSMNDALLLLVNGTLSPLWNQAAQFIPENAQPTTRVMLVSMGGVRQLNSPQQCHLWSAVVDSLKASAFRSGVIHLVSLDVNYPFKPRTCEGLDVVV